MTRLLAAAAAIGFLLCAGLLVGSGSTVSYGSETTMCAGPIVDAESQSGALPSPADTTTGGLAQACATSDASRLHWAVLAGALALVAGAVCARAGAPQQEVSPRVEAAAA